MEIVSKKTQLIMFLDFYLRIKFIVFFSRIGIIAHESMNNYHFMFPLIDSCLNASMLSFGIDSKHYWSCFHWKYTFQKTWKRKNSSD